MELFTPRNVAKYVAQAIVQIQSTKLTEDAITGYTRFEEDDTIVTITSHVVGWYVSHKLKPYTDKVVDTTADFIDAKREARKARKENTTEK